MNGVYLTRDAGTPALARLYRILMVPTLFGASVLLREWDRVGAGGTVKADTFPNAGAAVLALQAITREKWKRGYRSLEGPAVAGQL